MVGRHHLLNGHEFEQTLGESEGQGSLVCCSPWGHRESDTTEPLNNRLTCGHVLMVVIVVGIDCSHPWTLAHVVFVLC